MILTRDKVLISNSNLSLLDGECDYYLFYLGELDQY